MRRRLQAVADDLETGVVYDDRFSDLLIEHHVSNFIALAPPPNNIQSPKPVTFPAPYDSHADLVDREFLGLEEKSFYLGRNLGLSLLS